MISLEIKPRWVGGIACSVAAALCVGLATPSVAGSAEPYWIYLRARLPRKDLAQLVRERLAQLSPATRRRRFSVRDDLGADQRDLPLSPSHLRAIAKQGLRVRVISRWLNAVSVLVRPAQLLAISRLPFVKGIARVGRSSNSLPGLKHRRPAVGRSITASSPYGEAAAQLAVMQVPRAHTCGFHGRGIVVGVLDTGFRLDHRAFASLDLRGQRDFVHGDAVVSPQAGDRPTEHQHGTMVLAMLAGLQRGVFSGVAPEVGVLLAKVDDPEQDIAAEDDWWVAGLEWAEARGADLITTSIGFCAAPCRPEQLDGLTEATSRAAAVAAENGLLIVAAAGNGGPQPGSVVGPADAVGVIAVGSVDLDGAIAVDSARGPTADGRRKPDLVAPGVGVLTVDPDTVDGYRRTTGTSFAAPMVAGVAALLMQAMPDRTAALISKQLSDNASRSERPDTDYGFGVPQAGTSIAAYCQRPVDAGSVLRDAGAWRDGRGVSHCRGDCQPSVQRQGGCRLSAEQPVVAVGLLLLLACRRRAMRNA